MLRYFYGTRLTELADTFIDERSEAPVANPLEKETFIVQNHGIGQWLSLYIARNEGIAANMEFMFPSEIIWKLIRNIDPDIPDTLPSDRQPMTASLMQLLSDKNVLTQFPHLEYYIQSEEKQNDAMRLWQLSSQIADVLDQYLVYRPDMILGWEQKPIKHTYGTTAERWQAKLWNRLRSHWENNYSGKWLHRAELQRKLYHEIESNHFNLDELPSRLTVFGVSMMPPTVIKALTSLADEIDIDFYQLSINPEVKDSEQFQNPLLQSLGKESARFFALFDEYSDAEKENIHISKNEKDSLFSIVQSELIRDTESEMLNAGNAKPDSSIQIHSCHSPMREVEVLYDRLLEAFDEDPELSPDDVLIMTPDIETYAPVIEAVFEAPDEGQPEIPFGIADRNISGDNPAIESFIQILKICDSRFKVTEVLDLLNAPPVKDCYELSDYDQNRIERWVRDNRVRWGVDGDFKKSLNLPESSNFTWKAALERIMLGYSMNSDGDQLYKGLYPYEEIETSDDARLAGKLSRYLRSLFDFVDEVEKDRTVREWTKLLGDIPDIFLSHKENYYRDLTRIRQLLEDLNEWAKLSNLNRKIPYSVIRTWISGQLEEQKSGGGRLGRGVTFSSLKPMRSIPFKFVGMLGMNEDAFPRSKIPAEFDLIHLNPEPGDPIRSEEDRNLFLENIMSAENTIYFSYVGQSNQQDTDFPPSVVLTEFCDYLEEYYDIPSGNLVQKHHLQAFSPQYFKGGPLSSYSIEKKEIAKTLLRNQPENPVFVDEKLPEPEEDQKHISINDLVSFYQNPSKYFLRNRLGIYLKDQDVLTEEREPFQLDKLDEYSVGQELLKRYLKDQELDTYENILRSKDMLPEGWSGRQAYAQKKGEVLDFGNHIRELMDDGEPIDEEVSVALDKFRITGGMSNIYPSARMDYRFGKARPKDMVEWWINHLVFQEVKPADHPGTSVLLSWADGKIERYNLQRVETPAEQLYNLLAKYWEGLQAPLTFFCKSSYAYAESILRQNKNHESALAEALKKWEPVHTSYYSRPGEREDDYISLVADGREPLKESEFVDLSIEIWKPFFELQFDHHED